MTIEAEVDKIIEAWSLKRLREEYKILLVVSCVNEAEPNKPLEPIERWLKAKAND